MHELYERELARAVVAWVDGHACVFIHDEEDTVLVEDARRIEACRGARPLCRRLAREVREVFLGHADLDRIAVSEDSIDFRFGSVEEDAALADAGVYEREGRAGEELAEESIDPLARVVAGDRDGMHGGVMIQLILSFECLIESL